MWLHQSEVDRTQNFMQFLKTSPVQYEQLHVINTEYFKHLATFVCALCITLDVQRDKRHA
jgi:hypothetical protein